MQKKWAGWSHQKIRSQPCLESENQILLGQNIQRHIQACSQNFASVVFDKIYTAIFSQSKLMRISSIWCHRAANLCQIPNAWGFTVFYHCKAPSTYHVLHHDSDPPEPLFSQLIFPSTLKHHRAS